MIQFDLEYEVLLHNLKAEFLACQQDRHNPGVSATVLAGQLAAYHAHVQELRRFVRRNFNLFDASNVSSLLAIPTRALTRSEKLIHRIWMGGRLPAVATEAVQQWDADIAQLATRDAQASYRQWLWVWDAAQLHDDPLFRPTRGLPDHAIGSYAFGCRAQAVHSLRELIQATLPACVALLTELHDKKYFVNLSDFFRLLILYEYGGIYMDADTIPHKSATVFLSKPELPHYSEWQGNTGAAATQRSAVSWMNLFADENGFLVAARRAPALRATLQRMGQNVRALPPAIPARDQPDAAAAYAAQLHDATYGAWLANLGITLRGYHALESAHSVLHHDRKEPVIHGVGGMRLLVDAFSQAEIPLDADEQQSYRRAVAALAQRDWRLDNPLELENLVAVYCMDEVPRMAYAPQLRATRESCHYYSFLSRDSNLDRVNTLFAAYLIRKNSQRIRQGDFWRATGGVEPHPTPAPSHPRIHELI
ncbi:MAG: glycosyltransferase [Pseudomonadota bacterium]